MNQVLIHEAGTSSLCDNDASNLPTAATVLIPIQKLGNEDGSGDAANSSVQSLSNQGQAKDGGSLLNSSPQQHKRRNAVENPHNIVSLLSSLNSCNFSTGSVSGSTSSSVSSLGSTSGSTSSGPPSFCLPAGRSNSRSSLPSRNSFTSAPPLRFPPISPRTSFDINSNYPSFSYPGRTASTSSSSNTSSFSLSSIPSTSSLTNSSQSSHLLHSSRIQFNSKLFTYESRSTFFSNIQICFESFLSHSTSFGLMPPSIILRLESILYILESTNLYLPLDSDNLSLMFATYVLCCFGALTSNQRRLADPLLLRVLELFTLFDSDQSAPHYFTPLFIEGGITFIIFLVTSNYLHHFFGVHSTEEGSNKGYANKDGVKVAFCDHWTSQMSNSMVGSMLSMLKSNCLCIPPQHSNKQQLLNLMLKILTLELLFCTSMAQLRNTLASCVRISKELTSADAVEAIVDNIAIKTNYLLKWIQLAKSEEKPNLEEISKELELLQNSMGDLFQTLDSTQDKQVKCGVGMISFYQMAILALQIATNSLALHQIEGSDVEGTNSKDKHKQKQKLIECNQAMVERYIHERLNRGFMVGWIILCDSFVMDYCIQINNKHLSEAMYHAVYQLRNATPMLLSFLEHYNTHSDTTLQSPVLNIYKNSIITPTSPVFESPNVYIKDEGVQEETKKEEIRSKKEKNDKKQEKEEREVKGKKRKRKEIKEISRKSNEEDVTRKRARKRTSNSYSFTLLSENKNEMIGRRMEELEQYDGPVDVQKGNYVTHAWKIRWKPEGGYSNGM